MTRNTCVRAFICGSHICMVVPSELESIRVGPLWRPSTETLMRHPSASIIGMVVYPSSFPLQRRKQAVDHRLRDALIGHRLEQRCDLLRIEMRAHLRIAC